MPGGQSPKLVASQLSTLLKAEEPQFIQVISIQIVVYEQAAFLPTICISSIYVHAWSAAEGVKLILQTANRLWDLFAADPRTAEAAQRMLVGAVNLHTLNLHDISDAGLRL